VTALHLRQPFQDLPI